MEAYRRGREAQCAVARGTPIEEDVSRAYIDGRNEGRRDERARFRPLLERCEDWLGGIMTRGSSPSLKKLVADLRAELEKS